MLGKRMRTRSYYWWSVYYIFMNHLVRYYDELWHVEITQIKTCHLFHGTPSKLTENNLEPKGHKYGLSKKRNVPPQKIYSNINKIIYSNMFNTILWSSCWQRWVGYTVLMEPPIIPQKIRAVIRKWRILEWSKTHNGAKHKWRSLIEALKV